MNSNTRKTEHNDPVHSSVGTLTALRESRILENRKRLVRILERLVNTIEKLLPSEVRPDVMAQIKRDYDEAVEALEEAERIDSSPHAGRARGEP